MKAYLFPGQGSQQVGMMSAYQHELVVKDYYQRAEAALGYDLLNLSNQGPEDKLNQTEFTQPALLAASVALYALAQQQGLPTPDFLAGHSLGEYSALVVAGVLSFEDGLKLVQLRGQLMQAAVEPGEGAMAAILGLDDDAVVAACAEAQNGDIVSAVNFNAPGQVVIAGQQAAVERAIAACKERGAKRALPLPVSVPSHCALMQPAADKLREAMRDLTFNEPLIPVVNNVDVKLESSRNAIEDALYRQLFSPVRWVESIQFLAGQGVSEFIECGPKNVLAGLNKRIVKDASCQAVQSLIEEQASCS